jgi:hypothetical protein
MASDNGPSPDLAYFGQLVKRPGNYRCWLWRGRWCCEFTSNSLPQCKRHGGLILPYPDEPQPSDVADGRWAVRMGPMS